MSKNVLLIFPKTGYDMKGVSIQMPMGLMCIASPLVKAGYTVTILDQRIEKDFFKKTERALRGGLICVGISALTGLQILYALKIAAFIRHRFPQVPLVWGGVHPTLTASQTIQSEWVDVIVRGEGEFSFLELVSALDLKRPLRDVRGITWREGTSVFHNPDREFCTLDQCPPPAYDLVPMEKYIMPEVPGKKRSLDVYTSRGCPHGCSFCYNTAFNRSRYRQRGLDPVFQEIEWLTKKYRLDSIYINDDNFFVDAERAHAFCKRLAEKKIVQEWGCQGVRIDSLEKIDFELLEKSGCKQLFVGIESGSEKILRIIQKGISLKQIRTVIEKFARSSIIAHYNFMVGYPEEGPQELSETIALVDHIMKIDPKAYFSSFHLLTPYPGTEFYETLVREGRFIPPENLKEWAQVRWEREQAPWISPKMRKICLNLTLLTYFIDRKGLDKARSNPWFRTIARILMASARWRWERRKFALCPEFVLLNTWVHGKIKQETRMACS